MEKQGKKTEKQEDMKNMVFPSSSTKSSTTEDRSDTRDSCYFPGCRKDANCNCEICLASFNATFDLMPMSLQKSSLTKFSATKPIAETTPIPYKPSILSTPTKSTNQISASPILKSTAKSNILEDKNKKKKERPKKGSWYIMFKFWRFLVVLSVMFAVDSAFSWMVSGGFQPKLSSEVVRKIGEESWFINDFKGKFGLLQRNLDKFIINGKVSDCSSIDSRWELNQNGLLTTSRCTLYKSVVEEVSIWGWPLQNEGLLVAGFSRRSLTILSGRLAVVLRLNQWPNGKAGIPVLKANSSWILGRLSGSAVRMEPNTWFLEYKQNPMLEHSRLSSAAMEFLMICISRVLEKLRKKYYILVLDYSNQYDFNGGNNLPCPT
ncbi:C-8 sterol isomerase [Thalictrum thalictroides]|uniref:C-8 sterol isomerase n=1 Tax=Thalictrum thalictroides TaxID=46969 RepID=A0A7J6VDZ1_THATH|nr:C-8 sterol isomerase [Thalictrum thalictroides]